MTDEHYKQWLNNLNVCDKVVVEQPAYRLRYYLTTVIEITPNGIWTKGFPGMLFSRGESQIGGFNYLLLEPTDELLDKVNLINNRRMLESTDWSKVDDDIVMDVWDLVHGGKRFGNTEYGGY